MSQFSKWPQVTASGHKCRVVAKGPNYNHLPMGGLCQNSESWSPFLRIHQGVPIMALSSTSSNIISPNIIHPWSEIGPICVCKSFGSPLRHGCVSGLGDDGEMPLLYLMSRGSLLVFLINILLNDFTIFYNSFYYGIILKFGFYSLWGFCMLPRVTRMWDGLLYQCDEWINELLHKIIQILHVLSKQSSRCL